MSNAVRERTDANNVDLTQVLVCTVATHDTDGLSILKESCKVFHINLTIIGWGEQFRGFGWRLKTLYGRLLTLAPEYRYALILDGFDTIFATGLEEIMARYLAMDTPLLISAETNCWPPSGPNPSDYPPTPTRYRYVNGGGYIGEISYIVELMTLRNVAGIHDAQSDQAFWAGVYTAGDTEMKLDYECEIFQSLLGAQADLAFAERIYNRITRSTPCIFHGNGHTGMGDVRAFILRDRYWRAKKIVHRLLARVVSFLHSHYPRRAKR